MFNDLSVFLTSQVFAILPWVEWNHIQQHTWRYVYLHYGSNLQVKKMGEKLQGLQEEKHQLFLQLKKVLHEEEKRRRKEQR